MATREITDELIDEAAGLLLAAATPPARVILFGSRARGDHDERSDVDFLVVEDAPRPRRAEIVRLQRALSPLRIPADVVVVSRAEASRPAAASDAIRQALLEGRLLAESTAA